MLTTCQLDVLRAVDKLGKNSYGNALTHAVFGSESKGRRMVTHSIANKLVENGLLELVDRSCYYQLTRKGELFLKAYKEDSDGAL